MPSEHVHPPPATTTHDTAPAQAKVCSRCDYPLNPLENDLILLACPEAVMLCPFCRDGPSRPQPSLSASSPRSRLAHPALLDLRPSPQHPDLHPITSDGARRAQQQSSPACERPLRLQTETILPAHPDEITSSCSPPSEPSFTVPVPFSRQLAIPAAHSSGSASFVDRSSSLPTMAAPLLPATFPKPESPLTPVQRSVAHDTRGLLARQAPPPPNPFVDITHIRMRPRPHHCLYPGSTFQGTQKSGRNSYDVTVTIVDVDFAASHLCGYLCIRELTDDWPELTTYFDAEIIGGRYGFLTHKWGATEEEDLVHWGRFPAFRHVKNKLKAPMLTTDADAGAVFMRWKERFLVPDHRVHDINGASFAGFYYVCVDLNASPAPASSARSAVSPVRERTDTSPSAPKPEVPRRARARSTRTDSGAATHPRSVSSAGRGGPAVATMSGFYFHQHSEPYQQLSLKHVQESFNTGFELR